MKGEIYMKVLFAVSEAKPFIASGGLGDVAGSLPQALRKRMIGCRVVMPLYSGIKQEYRDFQCMCLDILLLRDV